MRGSTNSARNVGSLLGISIDGINSTHDGTTLTRALKYYNIMIHKNTRIQTNAEVTEVRGFVAAKVAVGK